MAEIEIEKTMAEWIFVSIFTIFSVMAFFCYIYFLFFWTKNKLLIGSNFWAIMIFDTLLIMLLPIGGIIKGCYMLFINASKSQQFTIYLMSVGSSAYRFTVISIIIDRFLATYFSKSYENGKNFKYLAYFINTFTAAFIFGVSYFLIYVKISTTKTLFFIACMSFLGVTFCFLIVKRNQTLRKKTRDNPMLQQRYQLAQNIRLLKFIQPYVILKAVISILAIVIMFTFHLVSDNMSFAYLSLNGTYYIGTFIKVGIIFYLEKKRAKRNHRIIAIIPDQISTKTTVITTLGEELPTHVTVDSYFSSLKNTWN